MKSFFFERLPLSLFMLWIGTNDSNSPTPANQSTFCTNFTNGKLLFSYIGIPFLNYESILLEKISLFT